MLMWYINVTISLETCAFGDTPGNLLGIPVTTCAAIVGSTATSYNCYQDYYRKQCCATCEQYRLAYTNLTGIPAILLY
ncbi:hypothetical protein DPMN_112696 [Dreissena polymorpha]|uniref:Uncharacterized protein n=1 Tax=Dreissena polymorpha TaxID=45954 RepID=A0A9D4KG46_DREPO|nr:hypothetical protein DPMN_112696 [Dreissena polymorpha]